MSFATYGDMRSAVEAELDLEDELFVTPSEMLKYANEGVHEAELVINNLDEDYFLTNASLSLVSAQAGYDLPADIFANKIRAVRYNNGTNKYRVDRFRGKDMFDELDLIQSNDRYKYVVLNSLASGFKMTFYPTPVESGSYITIWYLRNARVITQDSDVVDIPEFRNFIERYMVWKCLLKEGHPNTDEAAAALKAERELMVTTLKNRIPDNDDMIQMDLSAYEEMS